MMRHKQHTEPPAPHIREGGETDNAQLGARCPYCKSRHTTPTVPSNNGCYYRCIPCGNVWHQDGNQRPLK
jgi:DNA-directed RNA polymerase subunit RPC12/RpoP